MRSLGIPLACVLAATLTGCEMLGFSTPTNPLLPEAKQFRQIAPASASVSRELSKELLPTYVVEPGDTLLVQPVEFDSPVRFPPDQPVLLDGTIDLGVYGRPVAAGKTLAQIELEVQELVNAKERAKLAKMVKEPEKAPEPKPILITVRLVGRVSKVYYVLGEVHSPNAYPLSGRETVLDAIMQAGGLNKQAAHDLIILSRPTPPDGCRLLYPVCYDQIVQLGDTTTNYQLQPGDRVFVPSQGILETLLPCLHRRQNGPCCRPQVSCFGGECHTAGGVWAAPAATIPVSAVGTRAKPAAPLTQLPAVPTPLPVPSSPSSPNPPAPLGTPVAPVAPLPSPGVPPAPLGTPVAPIMVLPAPVAPAPVVPAPTAPAAPVAPVTPAAPQPPPTPVLPVLPPSSTPMGSFGTLIRLSARLP